MSIPTLPISESGDAIDFPDDNDDEHPGHTPSPDLVSADDPVMGNVKPDVVPVGEAGIANDYNLDTDDGVNTGP